MEAEDVVRDRGDGALDGADASQGAAAEDVEGSGQGRQAARLETDADRLVGVVLRSGVELFRDQRDEPYAMVQTQEGPQALRIGSERFERWMWAQAWRELGRAPSGGAVAGARRTLDGIARFDRRRRRRDVRCARHGGAVWIDLGGGAAVRVEAAGWEVTDAPPMVFRSPRHQEVLPGPVPGGDVRRVFDFANLTDPGQQLLYLCYLATLFIPWIGLPVLALHGPSGSGKTTAGRVTKALADPSSQMTLGLPPRREAFARLASQHRVLFFDNVTSAREWQVDSICRCATGDSVGWGAPGDFEDASFVAYRPAVILSGIDVVSPRADLLNRSLLLGLGPIDEASRWGETELQEAFMAARPAILGGLLDMVAGAMAIEPDLRLDRLPRMADFARWGAAMAEAAGEPADDFLAAYAANNSRQTDEGLAADPLGEAVLALIRERPVWSGTPTELLGTLEQVALRSRIRVRGRGWPGSPNWLVRRLHILEPLLAAAGVRIEEERAADIRTITLCQLRAGEESMTI